MLLTENKALSLNLFRFVKSWQGSNGNSTKSERKVLPVRLFRNITSRNVLWIFRWREGEEQSFSYFFFFFELFFFFFFATLRKFLVRQTVRIITKYLSPPHSLSNLGANFVIHSIFRHMKWETFETVLFSINIPYSILVQIMSVWA